MRGADAAAISSPLRAQHPSLLSPCAWAYLASGCQANDALVADLDQDRVALSEVSAGRPHLAAHGLGQGDLPSPGHGGHLAVPVPAHCHRGFHGGQVLSDPPLHRGPLCPGFGPHGGGGFFLPSGGDRARKTHQAPDLGYRGSREVQVGAQPGPASSGRVFGACTVPGERGLPGPGRRP